MNKLSLFTLIVVIGAVVLSKPLLAANIEHVNVGRIAVSDQSIATQQRAGKQALEQVFIKLSGNKHIVKTPTIARAIDNHEQFLSASSFLQQNDNLLFEATFNRQKVENLLMASGLSVWASLRPSAILWLGREGQNDKKDVVYQNRAILRDRSSQAISFSELLKAHAYARGVEIVLPIGDLEDTTTISVYDVWNQHVSYLTERSQRYAADYLISATLEPYTQEMHLIKQAQNEAFKQKQIIQETNASALSDDIRGASGNDNANETNITQDTRYKIDYIITNRKSVMTGTLYGDDEVSVVTKLVDTYADTLAKLFALSAGAELDNIEAISLVVSNIDSLGDYVALIRLIESVPAVSKVQLTKQAKQTSHFSIQQNISVAQLRSILSLDPRLGIVNDASQVADLQFSWQD